MLTLTQYSPVPNITAFINTIYQSGYIVVINDSDAQLTFSGIGGQSTIPSGYAYAFAIPPGSGTITLAAATYVAQTGYAQLVTVNAYQAGELSNPGAYPVAIARTKVTAQTISDVGVYGFQTAPSPGTGSVTVSLPAPAAGLKNYLTGYIVSGQIGYNSPTTRYNCTIDIDHIITTPTAPRFYAVQSEYGLYQNVQFPYPVPQDTSGNQITMILSGFSELCSVTIFGTQQ